MSSFALIPVPRMIAGAPRKVVLMTTNTNDLREYHSAASWKRMCALAFTAGICAGTLIAFAAGGNICERLATAFQHAVDVLVDLAIAADVPVLWAACRDTFERESAKAAVWYAAQDTKDVVLDVLAAVMVLAFLPQIYALSLQVLHDVAKSLHLASE